MLALPVVHQPLVHHGNSTIPQEPLNRPAINLHSAVQRATPSPCAEPLLAESHALAKKKTGSDAHRNGPVQPGHARSDSAASTKGTHRLTTALTGTYQRFRCVTMPASIAPHTGRPLRSFWALYGQHAGYALSVGSGYLRFSQACLPTYWEVTASSAQKLQS